MALKTRTAGTTYLRLSEYENNGKKELAFFLSKDKTTPYAEIEGVITGFHFKDEEWENNPIRKCYIEISDSDGTYSIGINTDTGMFPQLIGFLANVDLSKPLSLIPSLRFDKDKTGKEVKRRTLFVKQGEKFAKNAFNAESGVKVPSWNKVQVGKKTMIDKSEFLEFYENIVTKKLAKLVGSAPTITETETRDEAPIVDDDLPFSDGPSVDFDETTGEVTPTGGKLPWED